MQIPLIKDDALVYLSGDCVITPYPTPSLLAMAFLRMENEKLIDTVFHSGPVDVSWFLNKFVNNRAILACWVRIDGTPYLAGLTWFNETVPIGDCQLRKAEVGIVFFKGFWKRKWTIRLAGMSAEWAFSHLNVYALFGTTPEPNRAACMFFRSLGFGGIGPLPNYTTFPGYDKPVGVYLSYMDADTWRETRLKLFTPPDPDASSSAASSSTPASAPK